MVRMNIIEKLRFILKESPSTQYGVKNIPVELSETDMQINDIFDYYMNIDQDEQEQIHKLITIEIAWLLLCFGIRMATYSLRLSNQVYFTNGLYAISMTLGVLDERELLVVLPLYYDVHKKNGLSFDKIFKQDNRFSPLLENFVNRGENDKSLECMGYILEFDDSYIPTYRRTW